MSSLFLKLCVHKAPFSNCTECKPIVACHRPNPCLHKLHTIVFAPFAKNCICTLSSNHTYSAFKITAKCCHLPQNMPPERDNHQSMPEDSDNHQGNGPQQKAVVALNWPAVIFAHRLKCCHPVKTDQSVHFQTCAIRDFSQQGTVNS